jgi:hypothetical protein
LASEESRIDAGDKSCARCFSFGVAALSAVVGGFSVFVAVLSCLVPREPAGKATLRSAFAALKFKAISHPETAPSSGGSRRLEVASLLLQGEHLTRRSALRPFSTVAKNGHEKQCSLKITQKPSSSSAINNGAVDTQPRAPRSSLG